jgi:hypothetical protein
MKPIFLDRYSTETYLFPDIPGIGMPLTQAAVLFLPPQPSGNLLQNYVANAACGELAVSHSSAFRWTQREPIRAGQLIAGDRQKYYF